MKCTMTSPCAECPFRNSMKHGFTIKRLSEFAQGAFPCHKTANAVECDEVGSEYRAGEKSVHCAGALIFLEKRNHPNQMMRIAERLGLYDRTKLDMEADVR